MFAKKHTSVFGAFVIDSKGIPWSSCACERVVSAVQLAVHSRVQPGGAQAFASQRASRSACRAIEGRPGQVQVIAGERVSRPLSFDEGGF